MRKALPLLLLITLVVAILFGLLFSRKIAEQFQREIRAELPTSVKVDYNGRHAYLRGTLPSEEAKDALRKSILSIDNDTAFTSTPGTAHVHMDDVTVRVPERSYVGLSVAGNRVRLRGEVPSAEHEKALLVRAGKAYPGSQIVDEITLDSSLAAVDDESGESTYGTFPVPAKEGVASVLAGTWLGEPWKALDLASGREALVSDLAAYPPKAKSSHLDPLVVDHLSQVAALEKMATLPRGWVGLSQYGRNALLKGQVPTEEVKSQILAGARLRYIDYQIIDQIEVTDGVKPGVSAETASTFPEAQEPGWVGATWLGEPWQQWGGELPEAALRSNLAGALPEGVSGEALIEPFLQYRTGQARVAMADKLPRPYAALIAHEGQIDVYGRVRDEQTRSAIIDSVKKSHPKLSVNNLMQVSDDIRPATTLEATLGSVPAPLAADSRYAGSIWVDEPWRPIPLDSPERVTLGLRTHFPQDANYAAMVAPLFRPKPAPAPPAPEKPLIVANIYFALGEGDVSSQRGRALDEVRKVLAEKPDSLFEVAGHSCDLGDDQANLELSQKRAGEFREFLLNNGLTADQVTARGYGETRPAVPNHNETNRRKNRRVEITIR